MLIVKCLFICSDGVMGEGSLSRLFILPSHEFRLHNEDASTLAPTCPTKFTLSRTIVTQPISCLTFIIVY